MGEAAVETAVKRIGDGPLFLCFDAIYIDCRIKNAIYTEKDKKYRNTHWNKKKIIQLDKSMRGGGNINSHEKQQ